MNLAQLWSILCGRQTNFSWANASWTYYPNGDPMGHYASEMDGSPGPNHKQKSWPEENLPNPETLEQAIRERNNWCDTAAQHLRNEEYYRGLVIKIGKMLGPEAYTSDDGSVQQDVLCAKVPDLVARLVTPSRS